MGATLFILTVLGVFTLGYLAGSDYAARGWEHQAVKTSCAKYNESTSEFEWIKDNK